MSARRRRRSGLRQIAGPSLLGLSACMLGHAAVAQSFPVKPVRIIVAFPAVGGTDIVARLLGQKLTEYWGQQALVENRAGASGTIGTELAARAVADGHTMFMGAMGNLTVNKHLFPKMAADPMKDFGRTRSPTLDESGVPGYDLTNWFGLVLPAGTSPELIRRLHADVQKALAVPEVRDKLTAMGSTVVGSSPEQFGAYMRAESDKWAKLIAEAKIQAQ